MFEPNDTPGNGNEGLALGNAGGTPKLNKFDAGWGNPVLIRVVPDVCIVSVLVADPKRNSGNGFGEPNAKGAAVDAFVADPKAPVNVVSMSGAGGEVFSIDQLGATGGS